MGRVFLIAALVSLGFAGAFVTSGQSAMVRPNLFPDPGPQQPPYCKRSQGNLVVTVRSVGPVSTAPLVPFYVKVMFEPGGPVEKQVQGLMSGSTTDVLFPFPLQCFSSECKFTITVDSQKTIRQADRSNNTASGRCPRV